MYRYTDEEIARQSFELINNGYLIGATSKEDLPDYFKFDDINTITV